MIRIKLEETSPSIYTAASRHFVTIETIILQAVICLRLVFIARTIVLFIEDNPN